MSGSGLNPPTGHLEPKAAELETSVNQGASQASTERTPKQSSPASVRKSSSLRKATSASSGLRMPTGKSGLTRPSESPATAPVKEEGEGEPAAQVATTTKLAGPLKKMTSASGLPGPQSISQLSKPKSSRLAGPSSTSKLLSMKPHPQVASLSTAVATGSTSSLESCNSDVIKMGVSEKIDEEITKVKSDKSSDVIVEQEPDIIPSRPPPTSLGIDKEVSPSKEADILSPPAEFKILEKTASLRETRRISPEGMAQEDNNNRPTETPPKTSIDDAQSPTKQEVISSSLSESVERNLKNERESAGDSPSLVIRQEGEALPISDDKISVTSPPSVSDSKHGSLKIGDEMSNRMELKSKGFSQPETGQPAMDSPLLIQKTSADMSNSSDQSGDDATPRRASRELDQRSHDHEKPRARSLSPKTTHRVGMVSIGPAYLPAHMVPLTQPHEFSRSASNEMTGGRDKKPLKSSLRHSNSSAGVARNSSSSSLEGTPSGGKGKVTISPRSSQVKGDLYITTIDFFHRSLVVLYRFL